MTDLEHAQIVVMNLLDGLSECYSAAVADNFFTSISLAKLLLEHDTYHIGTLRSNRAGSGSKGLQKNLTHGEVYGLQNKDGIKLIMWKDEKRSLHDIRKTVAFSNCGRHWKSQQNKRMYHEATSCHRL
ncbi:unnamed protein product [Rotaria sp. Silwood2]|nr:unnamed protein product [Rotaria sp. Silwood2]CAF2820978.1 unnamed protein product [Rotaria sp. Silwood2]CAF3090290.1 unnamed protein product [Rotaria sp. Silwood2]CAF3226403.1 unnamed protein product [Rotaria sp. Silwood2]CAF3963021.1 unnamed protein product [Rotaria sp. Silwood2]